jgi:hypothetical protein
VDARRARGRGRQGDERSLCVAATRDAVAKINRVLCSMSREDPYQVSFSAAKIEFCPITVRISHLSDRQQCRAALLSWRRMVLLVHIGLSGCDSASTRPMRSSRNWSRASISLSDQPWAGAMRLRVAGDRRIALRVALLTIVTPQPPCAGARCGGLSGSDTSACGLHDVYRRRPRSARDVNHPGGNERALQDTRPACGR